MSVFVLVEFQSRPDRVDDLLDLLEQVLPGTRSFEGCKEAVIEQDLDEPTTVLLCERWISRSHFDAYKAWRSEQGDLAGLAEILAGRPATRFFSGRPCD